MNQTKALQILALSVLLIGCDTTNDPSSEVKESRAHIRPSWSPDGKTIAYAVITGSQTGIYLVDTSGANVRLLHAGYSIGCSWSPDVKWVVYQQYGSLYKTTTTGDSTVRLTTSSYDLRPAWSPDGKKIAYNRQGLWIFDVVTSTTTNIYDGRDFPSWHPNGEVTVVDFMTSASGNFITYYFYAVNIDSAKARVLCSFTSGDILGSSAVSPAGSNPQELVLGLLPFDGNAQVWKINFLTGSQTRLTDDGGDYAAYSPDGTKIVYTRTQFGDGGLWIMNSDGTGQHRLTTP